MRAWWMNVGDTDARLELRDTPVPQPGPGQLLVRVRAAGLNRGEDRALPQQQEERL